MEKLPLSVSEFAAATGIGRTKAYAEIKSGRLKPVKVGKRTIVPVSEAQAWLKRLAGGADDQAV
jgi:excisionase family DNA binding protein